MPYGSTHCYTDQGYAGRYCPYNFQTFFPSLPALGLLMLPAVRYALLPTHFQVPFQTAPVHYLWHAVCTLLTTNGTLSILCLTTVSSLLPSTLHYCLRAVDTILGFFYPVHTSNDQIDLGSPYSFSGKYHFAPLPSF